MENGGKTLLILGVWTDSCPGRLVDIIGRAGLFLEGTVSPALEGVEISITERGASAPLITVATNDVGAYRYKALLQ